MKDGRTNSFILTFYCNKLREAIQTNLLFETYLNSTHGKFFAIEITHDMSFVIMAGNTSIANERFMKHTNAYPLRERHRFDQVRLRVMLPRENIF